MNGGAQIEGLISPAAGITIGEGFAHVAQQVFIFAQSVADNQLRRVFQRLTNFLAAGNLTHASVAGIIFDDHDIAGEERRVRATEIQQHTVVTGHRDNLHVGD